MIEFTEIPTEQTTAVTDLLLAVVAFTGAVYLVLLREADPWKALVWASAFTALGVGAFLGAVVHGVVFDSANRERFWMGIHLSLGLCIALFVVAAVRDRWGEPAGRRCLPFMLALAVGFFAVTRLYSGAFVVFLTYEAVALLAALGIYLYLAFHQRLPGAGWMVAGILLSIAAAVAQASKMRPVTLVWQFNHNSVFHVVQTVALFALFAGLRAALAGRPA